MEKKRKISLSSNDIQKTIRDLKSLKKGIETVKREETKKILNEAVEYCKSQTPLGTSPDGEHLRDKTLLETTDTGYRIIQDSDYAVYVEFGTGPIGKESPHESEITEKIGWKYASGKTILQTKSGKKGWFYPTDEKGKHWKFTEGQPAHMQMYKTGIWLEENLGKAVSMKINEEIVKKW